MGDPEFCCVALFDCSGVCVEFDSMSFYAKLSPVEQFQVVGFVAAACVFFAVILRELFSDREIQIAARSLGLIGFALLGAFAYRMASTVERQQIAAARAIEVSDAETGFAIRTRGGNEFIPGSFIDGMRSTAGRVRSGAGPDRHHDGSAGGIRRADGIGPAAIYLRSAGSTGTGDYGVDAARYLLGESRWAAGSSRTTRRTASY